jgi:hypothetical protein
MRDLVRAMLFFKLGCEASLAEIRSSIECRYDSSNLPRNWKVQVRDVLKHDPEIEKTDDGTWLLRTQDSVET